MTWHWDPWARCCGLLSWLSVSTPSSDLSLYISAWSFQYFQISSRCFQCLLQRKACKDLISAHIITHCFPIIYAKYNSYLYSQMCIQGAHFLGRCCLLGRCHFPGRWRCIPIKVRIQMTVNKAKCIPHINYKIKLLWRKNQIIPTHLLISIGLLDLQKKYKIILFKWPS